MFELDAAIEPNGVRWLRFAKVNGKVGKLTMAPDGDGDVKLEWPDGEVSGYIKAAKLTRVTRGEARAAAAARENVEKVRCSWCDS